MVSPATNRRQGSQGGPAFRDRLHLGWLAELPTSAFLRAITAAGWDVRRVTHRVCFHAQEADVLALERKALLDVVDRQLGPMLGNEILARGVRTIQRMPPAPQGGHGGGEVHQVEVIVMTPDELREFGLACYGEGCSEGKAGTR